MTLAQVVYQMSNDTDFLSQLLDNPESALKKKGFELSQEELAFLLTAHNRAGQDKMRIVNVADYTAARWR
jgi:hypothetical protein